MKSLKGAFAILFFLTLFFSSKAFAQSEKKIDPQFFAGSWDLIGKDLPDGNEELKITFQQKENKWIGTLTSKKNDISLPLNNVRFVDEQILGDFSYDGNDIFILLKKKGDNEVTGNIAEMFDITGTRSK